MIDEINNKKEIPCEDVVALLQELKEGGLSLEDIKVFRGIVIGKISSHIAKCPKCLLEAEKLGLSVLKENT